ncbi:hypothetical protein D6833_12635, partial [Candidatus Parcubacteria bacterium]
MICASCGYPLNDGQAVCPLCSNRWEAWELQFAATPIPRIQEQISAWLRQVSYPLALEIRAGQSGLRVHMFAPPGKADGIVRSWASMVHQQTRWRPADINLPLKPYYLLHSNELIPALTAGDGDTFMALGGQLASQAKQGHDVSLRIWILGTDQKLQERVRSLAAYSYGTSHGVRDETPNPWSARLSLWNTVAVIGAGIAAIAGGALASRLISPLTGIIPVLG